jgi:hypothetical protein
LLINPFYSTFGSITVFNEGFPFPDIEMRKPFPEIEMRKPFREFDLPETRRFFLRRFDLWFGMVARNAKQMTNMPFTITSIKYFLQQSNNTMGNSLSTNFQPKKNRFNCLDDKGHADLMSYYMYMKQRQKKRNLEDDMDVDECKCMAEEELTAILLACRTEQQQQEEA